MESTNLKNARPETLLTDSIRFQSKSVAREISRLSENSNPNVSHATNPKRVSKSPFVKSKSKPNSNNPVFSPRNRIRERRFVVVTKKKDTASSVESRVTEIDCKCGASMKKCVCIAYETLRGSQDEFLGNRIDSVTEIGESSQNFEEGDEIEDEIAVSMMKRRREEVMEEARRSLPEYGKVMHLVKAFEKLTSFPLSKAKKKEEKVKKWELSGMNQKQEMKYPESEIDQWSSSFSSSDLVLTASSLGLEQQQQPHASVSSSWDNSVSSLNSYGGRRNRSSLDSSSSMGSRRSKKKQIKVTSPKPFKLRTEQRGRMKEEEFIKKLQEMISEEEKLRIPLAQGLPWTTDEPENLVKPHVKDITIPIDLKLHSDIRAVERAEFDNQVASKINLTEQYKAERERLQKLEEEEELKRLRKELIPKAQPMPYFDRPFIPKRSNKHPTIPRDPKFNIPQHKRIRCCNSTTTSSWSESGSYLSDLLYQQDL